MQGSAQCICVLCAVCGHCAIHSSRRRLVDQALLSLNGSTKDLGLDTRARAGQVASSRLVRLRLDVDMEEESCRKRKDKARPGIEPGTSLILEGRSPTELPSKHQLQPKRHSKSSSANSADQILTNTSRSGSRAGTGSPLGGSIGALAQGAPRRGS